MEKYSMLLFGNICEYLMINYIEEEKLMGCFFIFGKSYQNKYVLIFSASSKFRLKVFFFDNLSLLTMPNNNYNPMNQTSNFTSAIQYMGLIMRQ